MKFNIAYRNTTTKKKEQKVKICSERNIFKKKSFPFKNKKQYDGFKKTKTFISISLCVLRMGGGSEHCGVVGEMIMVNFKIFTFFTELFQSPLISVSSTQSNSQCIDSRVCRRSI